MAKKYLLALLGLGMVFATGCARRVVVVERQTPPPPAARHRGQAVASQEHLENGKRMFHRGRYRQAAHQFEIAIAEDPNNWEAHWWLGLTLREMRDYDDCLDHFRVAIRLHDDPDWVARVRVDVGLVWELRGDRDKALVEYDLALRARPGYADAIKARERLKERREALKEREDDKDKGHRGNKGKRRSERDD